MRHSNNLHRREEHLTPSQKLFRVAGATKHALHEAFSCIPLLLICASISIKVGQFAGQFINPKLHTPATSTTPVYTPERESRENPTPIPEEERGIPDVYYSADDDSVMRAWVVGEEKKRVAQRYRNDTNLAIITDGDTLVMPKNFVTKPLQEYKAEDIVSYASGTQTLMTGGWSEYIKFMLSSMPGLRKISMHFDLHTGTKEEKVKKIAAFLQTKENSMSYRHDLALLRDEMKLTDYMRKPIISLLEGLQNGGFQGDCEDFSTNFIALAMASGIPQEDMCIVLIPGHALVAVKNYNMSQADYPNFYTDEEGNKYIPVEATINAMPVTTNVVSHDGDIVTTSTTYERTPTVGRPHIEPARIRNKEHPNGFDTNLKGSRRYL